MKSKDQIISFVLSVFACGIVLGKTAVFAEENKIFYVQGSTASKNISITFDDGPGAATEEILAILEEYGVKATFFMLGESVKAMPDTARKVFAAGHEIGAHSFSHPNFYSYKSEDKELVLAKEMDSSAAVFKKELGFAPQIMRMPHGFVKPWVKKVAKEKGYILVNWTFGKDWKKDSVESLVSEYEKNIVPGAILLMHDGGGKRKKTVEILKAVLRECKNKDYKVFKVSDLCGIDLADQK